ncbi:UNVERIFIED_CONTAM: hypothetical protein Sindi_3035400, partial [Sesamum indicum]
CAKYILGLELAHSDDGLVVTQHKYAQDIIKDVGMSKAKHTTIPLAPGLKLSTDTGAVLTESSRYKRLVRRLLYLGFIRPGFCYAVQQLSQHLQHPCEKHLGCCNARCQIYKGKCFFRDTALYPGKQKNKLRWQYHRLKLSNVVWLVPLVR